LDALQIRWWLWPNVLSLDAPLIAAVWDMLFARCFHASVRPLSILTMALWVWLIYAADRTLDGFRISTQLADETARHRFYRIHRAAVAPWIGAGLAVALWLSYSQLRFRLFFYGLPLGFLIAAYFVMVHLGSRSVTGKWPKELVVAVLFAAGVLLPVWANLPAKHAGIVVPAILFAGTLWINAVGIERWEERLGNSAQPYFTVKLTSVIGNHLGYAALGIAVISALILLSTIAITREQSLYASIIISAIVLAGLDRLRRSLDRDALRVLADAALLSPLFFIPFIAG
jgi:hypothetical protein